MISRQKMCKKKGSKSDFTGQLDNFAHMILVLYV